MKNVVLTFCLMLLAITMIAQPTFQQRAEYRLEAELDDARQELKVDFEITYYNQSDQDLPYLIMHLWANAYQSRDSEFANQKAEHGSRRFYFSEKEEMGGYKEITWMMNGQKLQAKPLDGHKDVVKLVLPEILEAESDIRISGSYTIDIPVTFSRMGRTENSYQLTQWYPKPAVFDQNGWHPMPYLDIGEFYSEFGDYNVSITCPSDFIVAGTGQLETPEELDKYLAMADHGTPYEQTDSVKTLNYSAQDVHDFALFLDREFVINRQVAVVNDEGRAIDCWAFFHEGSEAWSYGAKFVKQAVEFGSQHIGEYPYPQATAVEGALSAGGGMEYPMITVIDPMPNAESLDNVIAHEVFHNWFYGILATNERDHPWMDEGFTSYYEKRYMRRYYPEEDPTDGLLKGFGLGDVEEALHYFQASRAKEHTTCCASREYHPVNYQLAAYTKPRMALEYLEDLYGMNVLDRVVQDYYDLWRFKHPQPGDVQAHFEKAYGMDMSWMFEDIMQDNKILDYGIRGFDSNSGYVRIANRGEISAPYRLAGLNGVDTVFTTVVQGHDSTQVFPQSLENVSEVVIDPNYMSLDIDRRNNRRQTKGFSDRLPEFHFLPGLHRGRNTIYLFPAVGWNDYDKTMLGLHFSNRTLQPRKFNITLNPMYGFGSERISGFGDVHYNIFRRNGRLRYTQIGLHYKSYALNQTDVLPDYHYKKGGPYIEFGFRGDETAFETHTLRVAADRIMFVDGPGGIEGPLDRQMDVIEATYEWKKDGGIHPQSIKLATEYGNYTVGNAPFDGQEYVRITGEYKGKWYYSQDKKIDVRVFGGFFPYNTRDEVGSFSPLFNGRTLGLAYEGYNDLYDHTFMARQATSGWLAHQIEIEEGGFKNALTRANADVYGNSNKGIASLNLMADLPLDLPGAGLIRPYFDMGYFADSSRPFDYETSELVMWSGGFSISLLNGVVQVYFPVIMSDNIEDSLNSVGQHTMWRRATFSLNLKQLNLYNIVEKKHLQFNF